MQSVSYTTPIPNPRKIICCVGKSGPIATFHLIFLGGWVGLGLGEFVGFIVIFTCFPTQLNLVYRYIYPIVHHEWDTVPVRTAVAMLEVYIPYCAPQMGYCTGQDGSCNA